MKKILTLLIITTLAIAANAQEVKFTNLRTKVDVDQELFKFRNDSTFKTSPYHPSDISNKKLWGELSKALESGKLEAYTSDQKTKLTPAEIKKIGSRVDTFYVENPDPPYDLQMKVLKNEFNPNDICSWIFYEDLVYDSKKNTLTKKVTYVTPCIQVLDPLNGELRGTQALMAIKMN